MHGGISVGPHFLTVKLTVRREIFLMISLYSRAFLAPMHPDREMPDFSITEGISPGVGVAPIALPSSQRLDAGTGRYR